MLGMKDIEVASYTGSYVDGIYVSVQTGGVRTIRAAIQPVAGFEVQQLPEKSRTKARWVMWVKAPYVVNAMDMSDSRTPADIVSFNGSDFDVFALYDWTSHTSGLPHKKYILLKIGEDE